jgi:hypothetical protein
MKQRDETIDILKGMLVFGMILAHVSELISSYDAFPMKRLWLCASLVTFSGFVFSFGYACQLAYFSKPLKTAYRRMLATALKPLIAFYISGIYWRAFVDKQLDLATVTNVLLLNDIPPFSEFLVAFSLIILVSLALFIPIQKVTDSKKYFWSVFILLLLTTFFPYELVHEPHLALLVGTTRFPCYPVLQYFSIYLLGIYFAKHQIYREHKIAIASTIGIICFMLFYFWNHITPPRFPPSLLWILGSLFFVYGYYLIARKLSRWQFLAEPLSYWGRNVLFYLLISNLAIFTFRGAYEQISLSLLVSLGITLLILGATNFLTSIVSSKK